MNSVMRNKNDAKTPRSGEARPFTKTAAPPPQPAPGGGGDRRPGGPTAAVAADGDRRPRVFSQLVDAVVPGWNIIEADYANHVAWGLLTTAHGGHVAILTHNPEQSLVRLQVRLESTGVIPVSRLPVVFRIEEEWWLARIMPDAEEGMVHVQVASSCIEASSATAVMTVLVDQLVGMLSDNRLLAVLPTAHGGNGRRAHRGGAS